MRRKRFDCVELQHRGGERILEATRGMTVEEQAAYWHQRTHELLELQRKLRAKRKPA